MDLFNTVVSCVGGLLVIIGYLLRDKITNIEAAMNALEIKLEEHAKEDAALHVKILEMYVTKAEYQDSMNKVFNILQVISQDIKGLMTTKADK